MNYNFVQRGKKPQLQAKSETLNANKSIFSNVWDDPKTLMQRVFRKKPALRSCKNSREFTKILTLFLCGLCALCGEKRIKKQSLSFGEDQHPCKLM